MNHFSHIIRTAAITGAIVLSNPFGCPSPAHAEDIDLFAGGTLSSSAKPNLLIILDNTANWSSTFPAPGLALNCGLTNLSTKYCGVKTALYNALNSASVGSLNIGLMMFNETGGSALSGGSPTGSHDGSYVRSAVKLLNDTNKSNLLSVVNGLNINNDKGSNSQNAFSLEEARRYFAGLGVMNGNNTQAKLDLAAENAAHTTYVSPAVNDCQRNFVLYISNGPPSSNDSQASTFVQTLNGGTLPPTIPLTPSNAQSNWMDEFSKLLYQQDVIASITGSQNIVTYGIALYDPSYNPDTQNTNVSGRELIKSAAIQGGGKYFAATDAVSLQTALETVFTEIQSVGTVFSSATLPLAVNIQGTYLNQVYMGMFVPEANAGPRWLGNLKQFEFNYDSSNGRLSLVDSAGNQAVSATTGFLVPTAQSFWSTALTGSSTTGTTSFWSNSQRGTYAGSAYPNILSQDNPDGEMVEKGGAAQQLRTDFLTSQTGRKIYTCPTTGCSGLLSSLALNTSSITGLVYQLAFTLSGALTLTGTELSNIVNWVRGTSNGGDEFSPGTTSTSQSITIRPSVHGDVLHSRPLLVDYCASPPCASGNVVAFYGGNDGLLHAVQAGRGTTGGHELWGFIAPEFFAKLKRLRDNTPSVLFPTLSGTLSGKRKDYFFDGSIGVYSTASRTIIYPTGRRGGNFVYAIDVSTPAAPTFLWKIDNNTSGFGNLAQTWSTPQLARVRGNVNPVLIFGAGYCGGYDILKNGVGEDSTGAATSSPSCPLGQPDGRGVYVVDAFTGAKLKFFQSATNGGSISDSVAADVTVLDHDGDGYVDRVYAADTGGTVWRMDVGDASTANWKLFKFARAKGGTYREKFLFSPDVVPTLTFDAVLIGSGDRENPLSVSTNNNFYMFKDFKTGTDATGMVAITDYSTMVDVTTISDPAALKAAALDPAKKGWYVPMATNGEKVVNAALTIGGVAYFSTNRPTPDEVNTQACSNLGEARAYTMRFYDGAPLGVNSTRSQVLLGGGLPPSPTAGLVQIDDSTLIPFCIGCGQAVLPGTPTPPPCGTSAIDPCKPPLLPTAQRRKSFWWMKTDQ